MSKIQKKDYAHQIDNPEQQTDSKAERNQTPVHLDQIDPTEKDDIPQETKKKEAQGAAVVPNAGWGRIMSYYSPKSMGYGAFLTMIGNSSMMSLHGYFSGKIQFLLFAAYYASPDFEDDRKFWFAAWGLFILGVCICNGLERAMLGYTGEELTHNVRKLLMQSILYKQLCWFDEEKRAPGALTNLMAEDITMLNGLTTETIIVVLEAAMGCVLGIVLAFVFCWPQAIIVLVCSPFMASGMFIMSRMSWRTKGGKTDGTTGIEKDVYEKANALLADMVLNFKTVNSFGEENTDLIFEKFATLLEEPLKKRIKNSHLAGIAHGYSQCVRMFFIILIFWSGSEILVKYPEYDSIDVYLCIQVLMHAAMGLGFGFSNLPSVKRAKQSAQNVFAIIDEPTTLDQKSNEAKDRQVNTGEIELRDVTFKYPARPDVAVLNKMNLKIDASQKIALVGASGCGKSTITSLLLRFYNPQEGEILIDGYPITEFNVKELRRSIGYVMQEPILFNQTIEENIKFGKLDATPEEIRKACEQANALQFIENKWEDIDKAEFEKDVRSKVEEHCKHMDALLTYLNDKENTDEFSVWELVWNVFEKADDKAKKAITDYPDLFTRLLKEARAHKSKGTKWDNLCFAQEWWVAVESRSEYHIHEKIVQSYACKFDPNLLAKKDFSEEMIKKGESVYQ